MPRAVNSSVIPKNSLVKNWVITKNGKTVLNKIHCALYNCDHFNVQYRLWPTLHPLDKDVRENNTDRGYSGQQTTDGDT